MNSKLSLFPISTAIDATGHLTIGGQRLVDLAQHFDTPLYLYDLATIRHDIAAYQQALATYSGPSHLTYASKAFLCPALVKVMTELGLGLDVASAGELFIAQHGGADPGQMHLHGNNKTRQDLQAALSAGVGRIVVDNPTELDQLKEMAKAQQKPVYIWLRVTPGVGVETHHRYTVTGQADSKFGFPLAEAQAVAEQLVQEDGWVKLVGLHIHLGSHFHDVEPVALALERLLDLAFHLKQKYGWALAEVCPGGGWGVRYHPDDPPQPIEPFVQGLVQALTQQCAQRGLALPKLVLEPGRSLIARAGVAVYTVGNRKAIPEVRTYVSVDGGLADNPRPALYQAGYTALLANRATEAEVETVAIAGPFCESGDIMIEAVPLPNAQPGDIVAVPVAGAYHLSMSSSYNGMPRPAVVFIDGEDVRLVQRRETFADLVQRDV